MTINQITQKLEQLAPLVYQESYDNCGLITGNDNWDCIGVLCSLDVTENVVLEAIKNNCNLIVAHHPIVFNGLKKINGNNYVERTIIAAIKNNIAIYAIHTNLDNILHGVNNIMANQIGLLEQKILMPKTGNISKLYTYVPTANAAFVRDALIEAGAGHIGQYSECSFNTIGDGTFRPGINTNPVIGQASGEREVVKEMKIEMVFPSFLQGQILKALFKTHPYEVVAYEVIKLENKNQEVGSGMVGILPEVMDEADFFEMVKKAFGLNFLRHTSVLGKPIKKVALCGGAGSFLTKAAINAGADVYITADVKYHDFFDAEEKIVLMDIGHWESEQFTVELLHRYLKEKFPTFAVLKTAVNTNPVRYFS